MPLRGKQASGLLTQQKMLRAAVKLFLEKGYEGTTTAEIARAAGMTPSSFFRAFPSKEALLLELDKRMFSGQFALAEQHSTAQDPVLLYAVETAIQLTLTERNENLRDIYIEAYASPTASEYIFRNMAEELYQIFRDYQPGSTQSDFYEMEIGSAGMMRAFMTRHCDVYFALDRKIRCFLSMSLSAYHVPLEEQEKIMSFVSGLDIIKIAERVVQELIQALAMRFEFTL